VILAPQNGRIEIGHLFTSWKDPTPGEFGLDRHGGLDAPEQQACKALCEAVLGGSMKFDQVEDLLLDAAVSRAHGNLSLAARLLGLTRPQLAYRLRGRKAETRSGAPPVDSLVES